MPVQKESKKRAKKHVAQLKNRNCFNKTSHMVQRNDTRFLNNCFDRYIKKNIAYC